MVKIWSYRGMVVCAAAAMSAPLIAAERVPWSPQVTEVDPDRQPGVRQWLVGGLSNTVANDVRHTRDGGIVVTGFVLSSANKEDAFVVKFDARRRVEWAYTYGGPEADFAWGVLELAEGGYALAGFSASDSAGERDGWLVRLNSAGEVLFSRTFGGKEEDRFYVVAEHRNGDLVAAGETYSKGQGGADFFVVRVDRSGGTVWERTYGGPLIDRVMAMAASDDQTLLVGIEADDRSGSTSAHVDSLATMISPEGEVMWTRRFAGQQRDYIHHVTRLKTGDYLLTGYTESFGARGANDNWTIVLGPTGMVVAETLFGGPGADHNIMVRALPGGGGIMAGYTKGRGAGGWDGILSQVDSQGKLVDEQFFGTRLDERFNAVSADSKSFVVVGTAQIEGSDINHALIMELPLHDQGASSPNRPNEMLP